MRLKNNYIIYRDGCILAFQFLSIIPIKRNVPYEERRGRASIAFYPLPGLVLGILLALQAFLLLSYTTINPAFIAFWLLFFSIIYSGGLHLDGWMDVSDAILSHRDKERKLAIMKDSHVGAFAVLSIFFLLGWRFLLMYEIILLSGTTCLYYFLIIPFLVRLQIIPFLYYGKLAKEEGMAFYVKGLLTKWTLWSVFFYFVTISIVLYLFFSFLVLTWLFSSLVLLIFLYLMLRLFSQQFGGITGDTIGATIEGGETVLWFTVWLLLYLGMG